MIDKIVDKKINYFNIKKCNKEINIKLLSDIHYGESFNLKKLNIIEEKLDETKTDYLFIAGDILDSTNFLYKKTNRKEILIEWFKKISKKYKIFICLGNHDYYYMTNDESFCDNAKIWKEIFKIPNVYSNYEDNYINIVSINLPFKYYINDEKDEDEKELIKILNKNKKRINKEKINILLLHSPLLLSEEEIVKRINGYDFVFAGHTHNGMIPMYIDRIIKGNKGLIGPSKKLFINNARGLKIINNDNNITNIIISGGITKIQECINPIIRWGNHLYPMSINEIIINKK